MNLIAAAHPAPPAARLPAMVSTFLDGKGGQVLFIIAIIIVIIFAIDSLTKGASR